MGPGTFTIDGNYTGTNGLLLMNEQVNAGGIASHLVIGGNAGGTTNVHVAVTRNGVQTNGDGIELVQVNGTSAANSFRLSAPVQSGAYQYLLYKGGAAGANNWYLRTTLEDGDTAANAAATAQAQGVATDFAEAAPGGAAASNAPVAYRPGVVGYSMTPLLNADYGFTLLGQLQDRVGDIANVENRTPVNQNQRNGIWARIGGDNVDANSSGRFSADERTFFAQFGKDWTLARGAQGGSTHAGVTVSFGSSSATFEDSARSINPSLTNNTGSVETQAQSIGGYWTKYLADGTYFDGVGQFTHYRNKYGDVFGDGATQNGFGAGASGEVGKPFAIGSTPIAIEPQAQLLYQYLHLNGFSDSVSDVSSNTTNALRGRIGFRVFDANLSNDAKTGSATPYFSANILHDFLSPGTTTVGATPFDDHLSKTWYELGLGVSATMGNASMLYANVSYAHNIGGEYRRQIFGQVGYRYSW
ncbi:autotransporter family protein [Paraburkholderia humisilvae]